MNADESVIWPDTNLLVTTPPFVDGYALLEYYGRHELITQLQLEGVTCEDPNTWLSPQHDRDKYQRVITLYSNVLRVNKPRFPFNMLTLFNKSLLTSIQQGHFYSYEYDFSNSITHPLLVRYLSAVKGCTLQQHDRYKILNPQYLNESHNKVVLFAAGCGLKFVNYELYLKNLTRLSNMFRISFYLPNVIKSFSLKEFNDGYYANIPDDIAANGKELYFMAESSGCSALLGTIGRLLRDGRNHLNPKRLILNTPGFIEACILSPSRFSDPTIRYTSSIFALHQTHLYSLDELSVVDNYQLLRTYDIRVINVKREVFTDYNNYFIKNSNAKSYHVRGLHAYMAHMNKDIISHDDVINTIACCFDLPRYSHTQHPSSTLI